MSSNRPAAVREPSWDECVELLESLPAMNLDARATAIERLVRNSSPGIRGRALRVGATVLSDDRVVEYLRQGDDGVLRNAGLEMLKMRAGKGFGLAVELLKDRDHDVVLQAVLALDHYKDPRALDPLRGCLDHADANVVQAAIVAIGHLGDARAIPELLPFLDGDPWTQLAGIQALGDLRSPAAVRPLAKLLTDMMVGPLAAEALARIGGVQAFRALASHWLRFKDDLDTEPSLGLLAHVLEGLPRAAPELSGLRESLMAVLESAADDARTSAARAILALGPTARSSAKIVVQDRAALAVLAENQSDPSILPSCLVRRRDLMPQLLRQQGTLTAWGFLLAARYPKDTPLAALAEALEAVPPLDFLDAILKALDKNKDAELAPAILGLYLRLPIEYRTALLPLFPTRRVQLREALDRSQLTAKTDDHSKLVLAALLGAPAQEVIDAVTALDHEQRPLVLSQIADRRDVLVLLPWSDWLQQRPENYGAVAAEVAIAAELRDLLPFLRGLLRTAPSPTLVRAVGELGDGDSVGLLVDLLQHQPSDLDAIILESLGRVGGPQARLALREATLSKENARVRMAYRALSLCATRDDDTFFRQAVAHGDWFVRLSCAEVLGRFSRPENMAALAQLAADPVPIVSQRALSFLEA